MTAAVALMAKDKGGPEFKCQVMLWPVTDANFDTESYRDYAEGYFLSRAMMQWFWDAYAPDHERRDEILCLSAPGDGGPTQRTASNIDSSGRKRCPPRPPEQRPAKRTWSRQPD
jgi:acetyl esterase/lipase